MSKTQLFFLNGAKTKKADNMSARARGGKGAFAPSCRAPQGHDQTRKIFVPSDLLRHNSSKRRDATTCPSQLVFLSSQVGGKMINQNVAILETPGKGAGKTENLPGFVVTMRCAAARG